MAFKAFCQYYGANYTEPVNKAILALFVLSMVYFLFSMNGLKENFEKAAMANMKVCPCVSWSYNMFTGEITRKAEYQNHSLNLPSKAVR